MTMQHWTVETDDGGVAWVRFDKAESSANVLSTDVMMELNEIVDRFRAAPRRSSQGCRRGG